MTPALFVLLVLGVITCIGLARPLPVLSGFALALAGLPVYRVLAARGAVKRRTTDGGVR